MVPAAEYRFTDREVREDPDLAKLAYEFAYNYGGDFDFLVHSSMYAREHGRLHTAMARGVLNCMRTDTQGLKLLEDRYWTPKPQLYVVKKQRPAWINLPSEWHYDYIMSMHKSAQVVHILDRRLSCVRWYPHTGKFVFNLHSCKPLYASVNYRMVYEVPTDRRLCARCAKLREGGWMHGTSN
jgi:hypothetical protein